MSAGEIKESSAPVSMITSQRVPSMTAMVLVCAARIVTIKGREAQARKQDAVTDRGRAGRGERSKHKAGTVFSAGGGTAARGLVGAGSWVAGVIGSWGACTRWAPQCQTLVLVLGWAA
ncbi:hypothetical protein Efla_007711 [Eimeria flavescens]